MEFEGRFGFVIGRSRDQGGLGIGGRSRWGGSNLLGLVESRILRMTSRALLLDFEHCYIETIVPVRMKVSSFDLGLVLVEGQFLRPAESTQVEIGVELEVDWL